MDDINNFTKLKFEQERVLKDNQDAQKSREKLKEDYLKLQDKLQTLPDVLSEKAMVPIGNVAFFPGHLIHTNEIMVLIGDNWFVERSAKQSIEIIERRIKMIEKQLSDYKKEETRIKDQRNYTDEFLNIKQDVTGIKEIQEELREESVTRKKGTSRKAHVAKHNQLPRCVKFKEADQLVRDIAKDSSKNNGDTIDHDELFARLNQLEREEQEEEEKLHSEQMKKIYNGEYSTEGTKDVEASYDDDMESNRRHVKFKAKTYASDDVPMSKNIIRFTHSPYHQRERSASESDLRNTINSPADVFDQFSLRESYESGEKPLKSILKKDSRSNSNENLKLRPILKTSPEHQPGTPELSFDDRRPILKTPPDSQGSDRRPGTPEYMLSDDPKPILKMGNGSQGITDDIDCNERKTILRFADDQLNDSCEVSSDINSEETEKRSILKSTSENSSPEHSIPLEDICGGNKTENRISILKSPDSSRSVKMTGEISERKTILKNTSNEAIKESVVERTSDGHVSDKSQSETSSRKRVSRFKASRSGK